MKIENTENRHKLQGLDTLRSVDGSLSLQSSQGTNEARTVAHKVSDFIFESLTGEPGFFLRELVMSSEEIRIPYPHDL